MREMNRVLVAVLLCGLWLPAPSPAQQSAPGAAAQTLVMGVFPRRDPQLTMRLFTPLAEYLQERTGLVVRLETAPDFAVFWERLQERRYDLVHFNQYHYIMAHAQHGYDVLVQNEEFGEPSISGALYVRRDSGIRSPAQLRGKAVMFGGGRDAMMAYLVPRYMLLEAGLRQGDFESRFAANPPNAVLATALGHADAGGAGEVVRRLPVVKDRIDVGELDLIAVSEPLPHLPWAVKTEMQSGVREMLRQAMLALRHSEAGRQILSQAQLTGFNAAMDQDYDVHRRIAESVEHGD